MAPGAGSPRFHFGSALIVASPIAMAQFDRLVIATMIVAALVLMYVATAYIRDS